MGVVDIQYDMPKASDTVFVDTNIWLIAFYEKVTLALSAPRKASADVYLRYFGRLRSSNSKLVTLPTVLLEIERTVQYDEYQAFCRQHQVSADSGSQDFKLWRSSEEGREAILSATSDVWAEVSDRSEILPVEFGKDAVIDALDEAAKLGMDIFDALHLQLLRAASVDQVLSDDIDFVVATDFMLLTKNSRALSRAAEIGELQRR